MASESVDMLSAEERNPAKRQRGWVARQACEACRTRKTRCDEDMPCGLCQSIGIDCVYAVRKSSKTDSTRNVIVERLEELRLHMNHLESKLDLVSSQITASTEHMSSQWAFGTQDGQHGPLARDEDEHPTAQLTTSANQQHSVELERSPSSADSSNKISFGAFQTMAWPGIRSLLSTEALSLPDWYAYELELARPSFTEQHFTKLSARGAQKDILSSLSLACLKDLSNAYFDTFNRTYPMVDREFYFSVTLNHVLREGFVSNAESCLVLNVMALGVLGLRAHQQAGFDHGEATLKYQSTLRQAYVEEGSELIFFSEALTRSGGCPYIHSIQTCQYYLTSAVFLSQLMRPLDSWLMVTHAATILIMLLKSSSSASDEWQQDMRSRVFWCAVLLGTVVGEEFELGQTRLHELEDDVALPKFLAYVTNSGRYGTRAANETREDDEHYQYHFLAQIAHRIILTRIRAEMYMGIPSVAIAKELQHQLEQWQSSLPQPLLAATGDTPRTTLDTPEWRCPADLLATTLLETRFRVGHFHLGRPFCYRAIHSPTSLTDAELQICKHALRIGMDLPMASGLVARMSAFMPLKFLVAGHMFGQLLIFRAFRESSEPRIRNALPAGHEQWCNTMLDYIASLAIANSTVAKHYNFISPLYNHQPPTNEFAESC